MRPCYLTAAGLGLLFTLTAQGAVAESAAPLSMPLLPDSSVSVLRVTGALALVVGLFLVGVWFYKNWQRVLWRSKGTPRLNLIEVRSLGGRHALYLVGYDQQRLLLAASPTGVQFITHLPDVEDTAAPAAPSTPVFAQVLDGVGGQAGPELQVHSGNDRH